jgi:hypothetical protein
VERARVLENEVKDLSVALQQEERENLWVKRSDVLLAGIDRRGKAGVVGCREEGSSPGERYEEKAGLWMSGKRGGG